MKRTCLIASDEEDVDGSLWDTTPQNRSRPQRSTKRKITTFFDSSSSDQSDDDSTKRKSVQNEVVPVKRGRGRPRGGGTVKTNTASTSNNKLQPVVPTQIIECNSNTHFIKVEPSSSSSTDNSNDNSNIVNSAVEQQQAPSKSGERIDHYIKKGKYDRQATPLCDAIMKAYSKRQKAVKMNGNKEPLDLNDLPIKEIIAKAKKDSEANQSCSNSVKNNEVTEQSICKVVKPPIEDTGSVNKLEEQIHSLPVIIKKEIDIKPTTCSKNEVNVKSNELLQPYVVIKRENLSSIRSSGQSEDCEEDKDDPTWSPENENKLQFSRKTRSTSKSSQITKVNLKNREINGKINVLPTTSNSTQPLHVTKRLDSVLESISDLLSCEDSSAIDDEAQKLLRTTQKLIKLKNDKLQLNPSMTLSPKLNIKQELSNDDSDPNISEMATLNEYNSSDYLATIYSKEKCTFMMEYLTSYQAVFNSQVFQNVMPLLSEILLLCMDDLIETLKRMKNAHSVTIVELQQKELQLASEAYVKLVMSFGERFFNQFDSIVEKIVKTKTWKPVMTTFIYFITNSLFTIAPKYKGQMDKVKIVLLLICRMYKYHHPLVWEVLETPDQLYKDQLKTLIQFIKYYHDRNLVIVPDVNLFAVWLDHCEKDQQIQTADFSLLPELVDGIKIPPSMYKSRHKYSYEKDSSASFSEIPLSKSQSTIDLASIAAQFFEALQTESDYNSKRIEEKLDHILSYLSDNKTHNVKPSSEEDADKRIFGSGNKNKSHLSQILQDHAGLDSLLMPKMKSTNCIVKSEPVELNELEIQTRPERTLRSCGKNSDNLQLGIVKQEPEEYSEPLEFATVVVPPSNRLFYSELNDESVAE